MYSSSEPITRTLSIAIFAILGIFVVQGVSAQPPGGDARSESAGATVSDSGVIDVNRIDPESFRALAYRLGPGESPRIDGRLDDEAWEKAPVSGRFIQREPDLGHPSTERTEFRVLYDDRQIYFGVWAFDSDVGGITSGELKRDSSLRTSDQIKINIDTFRDKRNAFYFSTNPLGAIKDAHHVDNGRTINYDWNAVWQVETSIDDRGWYAEFAIPFSQIRFPEGPGETTWGLNVCRIIIRKNEETYWVPYPREWGAIGFSRMGHAGLLDGLRDLRARRRLEFVPFVAPGVSRDYAAGAPAVASRKMGFDLRVGVTPTLTADVTYKTDFAQVEADQEMVNLTRFSLYFPEKRQFFTEAAGIFGYGSTGERDGGGGDRNAGLLPLFYSRRIGQAEGGEVPILAGARVTGRAGPYAIGVMSIATDPAVVTPEDAAPIAVPRATYSVFRVKRPVFRQSSVGAILLNRQGGTGSAYNRAAGIDLNLVFGNSLTMTGLAAKTFTPGLEGRDVATALDVSWKTDRWNAGTTWLDVPEHFNAEMGFIRRTDIRNAKVKGGWTPRPNWPGVRQVTLSGSAEVFEDHQGQLVSRNQGYDFMTHLRDSSMLHVGFDRDYDLLTEAWEFGPTVLVPGGYHWDTLKGSYRSNQSKALSGHAGFERGGYYGGDRLTYRFGFNVRPIETLLVETSYQRNRVEFSGLAPYVTNTVSNRISYSLSPELFVKSYVQYNSDRQLASLNLLFWYVYRPGSDLYVVYNHGWDTDLPGPHALQVNNRSFAVKFTYWFSR